MPAYADGTAAPAVNNGLTYAVAGVLAPFHCASVTLRDAERGLARGLRSGWHGACPYIIIMMSETNYRNYSNLSVITLIMKIMIKL